MEQGIAKSVELKVPVSEDYVSVVRLLISGLGNRLGLGVDELENLKLVVAEAFLTIISKCESVQGLIQLAWKEDAKHISVSISDPSGKHKSVTTAASLVLVKQLGGDYNTNVIDGVEHLNIGFDIKHIDGRPVIFRDGDQGQA